MRTQQHSSLGPAALRQWIERGLRTTVTYYLVPEASGASVNWSAGTAAVLTTSGPLEGLWVDGASEPEGVAGGGMVTTDAFFITAGPSAGAPTSRDNLVRNGLRYDVADVVRPVGAGGVYLLALKRSR